MDFQLFIAGRHACLVGHAPHLDQVYGVGVALSAEVPGAPKPAPGRMVSSLWTSSRPWWVLPGS